jgi:Icc protein
MRDKYLWITDPHIKPWGRRKIINLIHDDKPKGIFLTGDISYGPTLVGDLDHLGRKAGRPIYFVLGNHDYHGSTIATTHNKVRLLCKKHKNLIWMTDAGIEPLNEEVALIGTEGWYDARVGFEPFLTFTFDWWMTKDFRQLPSMKDRIEAFRVLAQESADKIVPILEKALESYKTIYLLTHYPPWKEANRAEGTMMEQFWLPYNVNYALGVALEKVMQNYKKRNLIVLCGHTHTSTQIHAARNIECRVGKAGYFRSTVDETIFI